MKDNKKYILNILLLILVTTIVLYFSLRDDFGQIMIILKQANLWGLLGGFILILITHYFCAVAITRLLKKDHPHLKISQTFRTRLLEQFARGVTPYQTGGQAMQCYALTRYEVPVNHSIYALSIDFIIYQCTAVVFQLIFIIAYLPNFYTNQFIFYGVIIATVINFSILVLLFLLLKWSSFHHFIAHYGLKFLAKVKILKNYEQTQVTLQSKIDEFALQINYITKERRLVLGNAFLYLINLMILHSIPFIVAWALHLDLSINLYFYTIALSVFVNTFNALNPIPGATGGTEAVFILLFGFILQQTSEINSLMLGWRFITFYSMILVGAIYFIRFMSQKKTAS